jgi:hypothetical protein
MAHDILDGLMVLVAASGFLYGWFQNREARRKEELRQAELRGVRGQKFRLVYRTLAEQHGWPINGEDHD